MAKVIARVQRPALILAPNKTLAAQLYGEFKSSSRQRGRVFRLLLRLLPARGLRAAHRHLYREGLLDQRADRADAPVGDQGAAGARRRHHRRLGVVHLRHRRSVETYHGDDVAPARRRAHRPAPADAPISSPAVHAQRRRFQRGTFRVRGDTIDIFPAEHYERPRLASSCSTTRSRTIASSIR
jgi:excinuclease ABC subunit B